MGRKLKNRTEEILGLLERAHAEVVSDLSANRGLSAAEMLMKCQDLAIRIGTQLEKALGEGTETVRRLEAYCEEVYQIHEGLSGEVGPEPKETEADLRDQIAAIKGAAEREISGRKEILFLPWKVSMWEAMREHWESAMEDPESEVFVVPLPYYSKKPDNSFGELHYEGALFPKEAGVISYEHYDIASRLPDVIVIQNPYDGCNYTSSIHPFYYAKNIKQYTDSLVYIPWFTIDEIEAGDERAKKSMEHFVSMPGVAYADEVILQSEKMKCAYVDFLTEWAGSDTRELWEKKITWHEKQSDKEAAGKEPYKKRILYYVSISGILEYGDRMLVKLENVLRIFKEQRDKVEVCFCPDPEIERLLPKAEPELYENYRRILRRFEEEEISLFPLGIEKPDYAKIREAASKCDAFYGDPSSVVQSFLSRRLPVMIQNAEIAG